MVRPESFAVHVTYTCPLTCAHCCFSSSPANKDSLPIAHIADTIGALDKDSIRMVAFTGGEPFLLGKNLSKLVSLAKGRGFVTRIVTSAYFGRDADRARTVIGEVRDAGLDELSISWDDFHEEFVSFECIRTVYWLAKSVGMTVAVNVVQARNSRWTTSRVKQELGVSDKSDDIIAESPLNLTGSASEKLTDAGLRERRFLGPCPYVLTGPSDG